MRHIRHACDPDYPALAFGLIESSQTTTVLPFSDSQNVVTETSHKCRSCGAMWLTQEFYAEVVEKWTADRAPKKEDRESEGLA